MIHISKAKGGFRVNSVADNGELLAQSEVLKTKQACWRNVRSMALLYGSPGYVQDDTVNKPVVWFIAVRPYLRKKSTAKPLPKFIPGKNKKK